MGDVGFAELLVLVIVAILCFGKDLPMVARKGARVAGKLRRQLLDIKEEVKRQIPLDDFDVSSDVRRSLEDDVYRPPPSTPAAPATTTQASGESGATPPPPSEPIPPSAAPSVGPRP